MFKKYGDPMPVKKYIGSDGAIVLCDVCNKPMIVAVINENDEIQLQCTCQNPDVE